MWAGFVVRFWNWFDNSGTILWGRVQILMGAIWTVVLTTDLMQTWLPPKYFPIWVVFSGVITELLRRSNTTRSEITVERAGVVSMVKYLKPQSPVPVGSTVVIDPVKKGA